MSYELVGDRVGCAPTHLVAIESGRITAVRATCGGRHFATVADPSGAIRRGKHMQQPIPAVAVFLVQNKYYSAPTLARLLALVAKHGHGQVGHRRCLDAFNTTVSSGLGHGDCGSAACTFSQRFDGQAVETAWPVLNGVDS